MLQATYKNKVKTYCVKCRKVTENIDPKMVRTKNKRLVMQSKCSVCGIKKSKFVKEQEAKGLLSNLGIKTLFSKIPLLNIFFSECSSTECSSIEVYVSKRHDFFL